MPNSGCTQFIKHQIQSLELKCKQIQQTLVKQPHRIKKLKQFKDSINEQQVIIQTLLRQINIIKTKMSQKENKVEIQTNRKCEVLIQIQNIQIQLSHYAEKIPNFFNFQPVQVNYEKLDNHQYQENFNKKNKNYSKIQDLKNKIKSIYFQMIQLEISSKSQKNMRNQHSISKFLCSFITNQLQFYSFYQPLQKINQIISMKDVQKHQDQNLQEMDTNFQIRKFSSHPILEQNLLKTYISNPLKFFIENQKAFQKFKTKLKVFNQQKFNLEEAQIWKRYLKNLQLYINLFRLSEKNQIKLLFTKEKSKIEIQEEAEQKQLKRQQKQKLCEVVQNIKLLKLELKTLKNQYEACENYIKQVKKQVNQLRQNLSQIQKRLDQNNSKRQETIRKAQRLSKQYDYFQSMRTKDLVQTQNAKKYLMQKLQKFEVQMKENHQVQVQVAKLKKIPIHSYKSSLNNNRVTIDTFDKEIERCQNQENYQNTLRPYMSKENLSTYIRSGLSSPNLFMSPRNNTTFKSPHLPSTSYKSPQQFSSTRKMSKPCLYYNNSLKKYKNKKPQQSKSKYLSISMTKGPWK